MTLSDFLAEWHSPSPTLHVHTSGSTGTPKDITVEKSRMLASARMTCDFLRLKPGNTALLCMPLDYIAGKMMVVRSIERGLTLISTPPSSHPLDDVSVKSDTHHHIDFAAFVPMQVIKSLSHPLLKEIGNIIIGGGAIDAALEEQLRSFPNNIYSSYGMTETLSHIALRRLSGSEASLWYTPLTGVTLSLNAENCLVIDAPHVCPTTLTTNDIAEIRPDGTFRILGRKDNVINSGGVKIQAEEVERQLAPFNVLVTSVPDPLLGEAVTLLVPDNTPSETLLSLRTAISALPKYWQPKHTLLVPSLPTTETGKPKRDAAKEMAKSLTE